MAHKIKEFLTEKWNRHRLASILALVMAVVCLTGVTLAAVYFHGSARGGFLANTLSIKAEANFVSQSGSSVLSFTEPGDSYQLNAAIENQCNSVLHYYYTVECAAASPLAKAVLVYYDGQFVGTLDQLSANGNRIENPTSFVNVGQTSADRLTFELHLAADETYYDGKTVAVTVSAFTENADYVDAIYVSDALEFQKAVDDINSGLLISTGTMQIVDGQLQNVPRIVLMEDIAAEDQSLNAPCAIELNGHTLSGALTLNSQSALLDVRNNGADDGMEAAVTLTAFDRTGAEQLLRSRILSRVGTGLHAGQSMRLLGTLSFYGEAAASGGGYTYAEDTITAGSVSETVPASVKVKFATGGEFAVSFKVLGVAESLAESYFAHMPAAADVVSTDLFLPSAVKQKNATIIWTSSNPEVMDNTGRIVAPFADLEKVDLYAEIRVNETVTTRKFSFLVTARTNQVNFYKLVAEISPMTIYYVYDAADASYTTYYFPTVGGSYDYRSDYTTPIAFGDYINNPSFLWQGYSDIGLTNLEYYMTPEQQENFDFVRIDNAGDNYYATLNRMTPNGYAQATVKGTFATGEEYEETVNIIIATGKNTEMLETAFNSVQKKLNEIDVLYNMLQTRKEGGMLNEKGDFVLPAAYEGYEIKYSRASSVISKIEKVGDSYVVSVDPTKFSSVESRVPLNVTISYGNVENTRTLYFTVPAAIHTADMGNATLFNTAMYQVWSQLPDEERSGENGFTLGDTILNRNQDYILLRDIIGDEAYQQSYLTQELKYADEYDAQHSGCTSLTFKVAQTDQASDASARELAMQIQSAIGTGTKYLTAAEVEAIKAFYQEQTGSFGDDLWDKVFETASGALVNDTDRINSLISHIIRVSQLNQEDAANTYFKFVETMQWADNEKDFNAEATGKPGYAPNKELIGGNNTWGGSQYYNDPKYQEDNTEYLSQGEIEVLTVLLQNASMANGSNNAELKRYIEEEFAASLIVPTYFTSDGIATLMNAFYKDAGIAIGTEDGFAAANAGDLPAIYNMDGIGTGLNYFTQLTSLDVSGNSELYAFQGENLLAQFFNRMTNTNTELEKLAMQYVAGQNTRFDVESTKNLTNLTHIDYSNNKGISNINVLVNTKWENYQSVKFDSYTGSYFSGNTYNFTNYASGALNGSGSVLSQLHEFDQVIGENMFAVNQVLDKNGNSVHITWRIEEGNDIGGEIIRAAGVGLKIDSITQMNKLISPYYYCAADFTYGEYSYLAGHMYQFACNAAGEITVTDLGEAAQVATMADLPEKDTSDIDESALELPDPEPMQESFQEKTSENSTVLHQGMIQASGNGGITTGANYNYKFGCYTIIDYANTWQGGYQNYFVYDNNGALGGLEIRSDNDRVPYNFTVFFAMLTQQQAEFYEFLKTDPAWQEVKERMETMGEGSGISYSENADGSYTILFARNGLTEGTSYYMFNPVTKRYVGNVSGNGWVGTVPMSGALSGAAQLDYTGGMMIFHNSGLRLGSNWGQVVAVDQNNNSPNVRLSYEPYSVDISGGRHEEEVSPYAPMLTIIYSDGRDNDVLSADWVKYVLTEDLQTYNSTTVSGFEAQSVDLGDPEYYYVADENTIYKVQYSYLHDGIDNTIHENLQKTVYTLSVTYDGGKSPVNWTDVEKIVFTYYTAESEDARVEHQVLLNGATFTWGTEDPITIPASDTDFKPVTDSTAPDEGKAPGEDAAPGEGEAPGENPDGEDGDPQDPAAPTFEWRIERIDEPYISHVNDASAAALEQREQHIADALTRRNGNAQEIAAVPVYRYTDTETTEAVYRQSATALQTSYTPEYGYYYTLAADGLHWSNGQALGEDPDDEPAAGTVTMDSILDEANAHFADGLYNRYYGRYYAYGGADKTTQSGVRYKHNWVYRLMPNSENSAFTFVPVKEFTEYNNINDTLLDIINGRLGQAQLGNLYYLNIAANANDIYGTRTYDRGFYILTYNPEAGSYYLKTFCDVRLANETGNLVQFNNVRINESAFYGGTGGTIPVVISAVVRRDNGDGSYTESVRYFKVDMVG